MGWFGKWIGDWAGRWFGGAGQQQQYTDARRFGRILKSADILFGDTNFPCTVSAGGVVLVRQTTDDYVRFRVPDTSCPPLPQPTTPLDSGVADEAEPNRWTITAGSPNTSNGWQMLESTDKISLSYTCYTGDFVLEVVGDYVSRTGSVTGTAGYWVHDGVCLLTDAGGYTYGIGVGWGRHIGYAKTPWGGQDQGRIIFWFVAQGTSKIASGNYLIPTSQTNVRFRLQRQGSQVRFGWLDSSATWQYSSWYSISTSQLQFYLEGVRITDGGPDV